MGKLFSHIRLRFAAAPWYETYSLTSEDETFMWHMYGRTLHPTFVRLPSGRTITRDELRQWFDSHPEFGKAE